MIPTLELVAAVVEVVHLRQAGVARPSVEQLLALNRRMPRHAARRLIGQIDQELQTVRHRLSLPLALSAEALRSECVEIAPHVTSAN